MQPIKPQSIKQRLTSLGEKLESAELYQTQIKQFESQLKPKEKIPRIQKIWTDLQNIEEVFNSLEKAIKESTEDQTANKKTLNILNGKIQQFKASLKDNPLYKIDRSRIEFCEKIIFPYESEVKIDNCEQKTKQITTTKESLSQWETSFSKLLSDLLMEYEDGTFFQESKQKLYEAVAQFREKINNDEKFLNEINKVEQDLAANIIKDYTANKKLNQNYDVVNSIIKLAKNLLNDWKISFAKIENKVKEMTGENKFSHKKIAELRSKHEEFEQLISKDEQELSHKLQGEKFSLERDKNTILSYTKEIGILQKKAQTIETLRVSAKIEECEKLLAEITLFKHDKLNLLTLIPSPNNSQDYQNERKKLDEQKASLTKNLENIQSEVTERLSAAQQNKDLLAKKMTEIRREFMGIDTKWDNGNNKISNWDKKNELILNTEQSIAALEKSKTDIFGNIDSDTLTTVQRELNRLQDDITKLKDDIAVKKKNLVEQKKQEEDIYTQNLQALEAIDKEKLAPLISNIEVAEKSDVDLRTRIDEYRKLILACAEVEKILGDIKLGVLSANSQTHQAQMKSLQDRQTLLSKTLLEKKQALQLSLEKAEEISKKMLANVGKQQEEFWTHYNKWLDQERLKPKYTLNIRESRVLVALKSVEAHEKSLNTIKQEIAHNKAESTCKEKVVLLEENTQKFRTEIAQEQEFLQTKRGEEKALLDQNATSLAEIKSNFKKIQQDAASIKNIFNTSEKISKYKELVSSCEELETKLNKIKFTEDLSNSDSYKTTIGAQREKTLSIIKNLELQTQTLKNGQQEAEVWEKAENEERIVIAASLNTRQNIEQNLTLFVSRQLPADFADKMKEYQQRLQDLKQWNDELGKITFKTTYLKNTLDTIRNIDTAKNEIAQHKTKTEKEKNNSETEALKNKQEMLSTIEKFINRTNLQFNTDTNEKFVLYKKNVIALTEEKTDEIPVSENYKTELKIIQQTAGAKIKALDRRHKELQHASLIADYEAHFNLILEPHVATALEKFNFSLSDPKSYVVFTADENNVVEQLKVKAQERQCQNKYFYVCSQKGQTRTVHVIYISEWGEVEQRILDETKASSVYNCITQNPALNAAHTDNKFKLLDKQMVKDVIGITQLPQIGESPKAFCDRFGLSGLASQLKTVQKRRLADLTKALGAENPKVQEFEKKITDCQLRITRVENAAKDIKGYTVCKELHRMTKRGANAKGVDDQLKKMFSGFKQKVQNTYMVHVSELTGVGNRSALLKQDCRTKIETFRQECYDKVPSTAWGQIREFVSNCLDIIFCLDKHIPEYRKQAKWNPAANFFKVSKTRLDDEILDELQKAVSKTMGT